MAASVQATLPGDTTVASIAGAMADAAESEGASEDASGGE